MGVKVISPPGALIPIADLRQHLKLDASGGSHPDDAMVLALAESARAYCEHYSACSIGEQTLELALDEFPDSTAIALPQGPVQSIVSVKYIDTAAVEQTLSTSAYLLDDYRTPAYVVPAVDTVWPYTLSVVNAVKLRYLAGSNTLAPAIRAAMLLLVGHWYEHREAVAAGNFAEAPLGVRALLDTQRDYSGAGGA